MSYALHVVASILNVASLNRCCNVEQRCIRTNRWRLITVPKFSFRNEKKGLELDG
jgi:hypothetical protein